MNHKNSLSLTTHMIKHFRHRGLQVFFEQGSNARIQPHHARRLARQLKHLDRSKRWQDMNVPGWKLHALSGKLENHCSVWVNGNWQLTFTFEGEDTVLVDYQDYR